MTFGCTSCSACCRRVGDHLATLRHMGFPYEVKADGKTCEKLNDQGLCDVYENRPDVCSVEKMYELVHSKSGKTKKAVFLLEASFCNQFIKEDGLDEKYLVNTKQYE